MKKLTLLTFIFIPWVLQAQNLQKIEQYIESARKDWNIPGVAVAIVKDD